jgi:hypothetical protein
MYVAGTDRYKISYSWPHGGKQLIDVKWVSLKTGYEVEEPKVLVRGAEFYNRALTPEEVKQLYEEGLKTRNLGK